MLEIIIDAVKQLRGIEAFHIAGQHGNIHRLSVTNPDLSAHLAFGDLLQAIKIHGLNNNWCFVFGPRGMGARRKAGFQCLFLYFLQMIFSFRLSPLQNLSHP